MCVIGEINNLFHKKGSETFSKNLNGAQVKASVTIE
jgi:hypothetical protein